MKQFKLLKIALHHKIIIVDLKTVYLELRLKLNENKNGEEGSEFEVDHDEEDEPIEDDGIDYTYIKKGEETS